MTIELAYEKLLKEHKLKVSDISEDGQTGIEHILQTIRGINQIEKKGKKPRAETLKRIKTMDKWVCQEILDQVNETDDNDPVETVEQIAEQAAVEIKAADNKPVDPPAPTDPPAPPATPPADPKPADPVPAEPKNDPPAADLTISNAQAEKIENELLALVKENKMTLTLEELKKFAPVSYAIVFKTYEEGGENGLETTNFLLKEGDKEVFTLSRIN